MSFNFTNKNHIKVFSSRSLGANSSRKQRVKA